MIFRVTDSNADVEILETDNIEKKEFFSTITVQDLMNKLKTFTENRNLYKKPKEIILFDDVIVGAGNRCVVINQPEHKRIVTYDKKAYKISFPNAIYIMHYELNMIKSIEAYCYKYYKKSATKLF